MAQGAGGSSELTSFRVEVRGAVQGVGFRPFVYNLARRFDLKGWVCNSSQGVVVEIEGTEGAVRGFLEQMRKEHPPLARILNIESHILAPQGYTSFQIVASERDGEKEAFVSPDAATCGDCSRELFDPANRRYHYPFTNCTNCGPRFTIMRDVPYDRERTTMDSFAMCGECQGEFIDPGERRFHAQPNACPRCGPQVILTDSAGKEVSGQWEKNFRKLVLQGRILAVKGLGGFHLACDATNQDAVEELRRRKHRPCKPFAVMCRNLEAVRKYCRVSKDEEHWLVSPEAPIVILEREGAALPGSLAPNIGTLGVMLPYTPLHKLLFGDEIEVLVMTSGNEGDLPLVRDNVTAFDQLGAIADYFLIHNREISNQCDDSLVQVIAKQINILRRSRGFTPRPVEIPSCGRGTVLGVGSEMKNAFCLLEGTRAFMSQYLGEMSYQEGLANFRGSLESFQQLLAMNPQVVAYDPHPGYRISALARELPVESRVAVQHHHAHMASCMAENGLDHEVVGVVCDGTGYGDDGCLWGCEVLVGGYLGYKRRFHLSYLPIPGGESSIRNNWRMAVAYLSHYLGQKGQALAYILFPDREKEINLLTRVMFQGFNSPLVSSCGRLFDAVSAMLGVCGENTYEGQAAAELSELVDPHVKGEYPFSLEKDLIDPGPMMVAIAHDLVNRAGKRYIATLFHHTVIAMLARAALTAAEEDGLDTVVLSGGSFQNRHLLLGLSRSLQEKGLRVYTHRQVPANDGGIALGQAVVAARRHQQAG